MYVGMPVYFDVSVENICNIPTKFKMERPGHTPSQYSPFTHPLNTPHSYTRSIHPTNSPSQYNLSIYPTHPINTPLTHPTNALSIHPIDTPSLYTQYAGGESSQYHMTFTPERSELNAKQVVTVRCKFTALTQGTSTQFACFPLLFMVVAISYSLLSLLIYRR